MTAKTARSFDAQTRVYSNTQLWQDLREQLILTSDSCNDRDTAIALLFFFKDIVYFVYRIVFCRKVNGGWYLYGGRGHVLVTGG